MDKNFKINKETLKDFVKKISGVSGASDDGFDGDVLVIGDRRIDLGGLFDAYENGGDEYSIDMVYMGAVRLIKEDVAIEKMSVEHFYMLIESCAKSMGFKAERENDELFVKSDIVMYSFDMDAFYENEYLVNEKVLDAFINVIYHSFGEMLETEVKLSDYEFVKDKLKFGVVNSDDEVLDVGVDVCIMVYPSNSYKKGFALVPVVEYEGEEFVIIKDMLEKYGVDGLDLYGEALKNSMGKYPPVLDDIGEKLGVSKAYIASLEDSCSTGAAVMFYTGFLDEMHEKIGDFFIFPASKLEIVIVQKCGVELEKIKEKIMKESKKILPECLRLCDDVYLYDGDLKICEE